MSPLSTILRRSPVLSYYVLAFAISWGGILFLVAPGGIPGQPDDVARLFPFTLAALFAGPSIAGLLMTVLIGGRPGLRDLAHRLLRWRVSGRWWAFALLTGPLLVAAVVFGLSFFRPGFTPGIISSEAPLQLLLFGMAWGLIGGGLLEELGWTGFAVPALRERFSVMQTGLIVGVLWGAWHLLIAVWASRGMAGETSLVDFTGGFLAFYFIALPAYRVLMVWLYSHTKSLLMAMLMHAVLSACTIVLQPLSTEGHIIWNLLLGVAFWVVVALLAMRKRDELSRPPVPPEVAHAW